MDYTKIIQENDDCFTDTEMLTDFIDTYSNHDALEIEDYITEHADSLVPIYYHDIRKEWVETPLCQEMTKEVQGEYDKDGDIHKMMQSDLFYYYNDRLSADYHAFLEVVSNLE